MKEVDIISKVVGRETGKPVGAGGSFSGVDLSGYLLKAIWDKAWDLRTDGNGREYVFGKLPVVLQYGLATYTDGGEVDLPTIFVGLPIDGQTLYWEETTNEDGSVTKVLKAKVGEGGGTIEYALSWSGYKSGSYDGSSAQHIVIPNNTSQLENGAGFITSSALSGYATQTWVNNKGYATQSWVNGKGFLTSHQTIYNLTMQAGQFSAVTFDPNGAEKTVKIPTTTSHITEGSNLYFTDDRAISALSSTLADYVKLTDTQEITGEKNFTGGLKVNGGKIEYNKDGVYWKLNGGLVVTGGIAAYSTDGQATPFLLDVSSLNEITSTSTTQVYSARTVKVMNDQVKTLTDKIDDIKNALSGINSSSSASTIGAALKEIYEALV